MNGDEKLASWWVLFPLPDETTANYLQTLDEISYFGVPDTEQPLCVCVCVCVWSQDGNIGAGKTVLLTGPGTGLWEMNCLRPENISVLD